VHLSVEEEEDGAPPGGVCLFVEVGHLAEAQGVGDLLREEGGHDDARLVEEGRLSDALADRDRAAVEEGASQGEGPCRPQAMTREAGLVQGLTLTLEDQDPDLKKC